MTTKNVILISATAVILSVVGLVLLGGSYPRKSKRALQHDLAEVSFQPHVDRDFVTITNATEMIALREAILAAREVPIGSYPPTTCSLLFKFQNGTDEEFQISPTGLTANNFSKQDPKTFKSLGYIMISWHGFYRAADSKAFYDVLHQRNLISASESQ